MRRKYLTVIFSATAAVIALSVGQASAAAFDQNHIIDDGVFDNTASMSIASINSFLNGFPSSCISPNNGFAAPDPTGYSPSGGFTYGGNVTAGQAIYDAAVAYGLNPQVLLATLQKEQSLVDGSAGCSTLRYVGAAGYGCPDGGTSYSYSGIDLYSINGSEVTSVSGTCVNTAAKAGFSQQIIHAAWLLKFGEQRSEGNINWDVQLSNAPQPGDSWNNSDDPQSCYSGPMTQGTWQICPSGGGTYYDGYTTIDGTAVHMDNGATASLYYYTPHFNGNENFFNIFTSWFGTTYTPTFQATYVTQSAYPTLLQGQSTSAYIRYKNTGNEPWYDDVSAPTYKTYAVHLATSSPINSASPFSATWPSNNRASTVFAHVYDSDGVTLASNQHIAQPGQIVEFDFTITAPGNLPAGGYQLVVQPILEGSSLWNMGGVAWWNVTVQPMTFNATYVTQSAYPTLLQGQSTSAYIRYKNTGNEPWYDDVSAPTYKTYAVHLATSSPINSASPFSATWPSNNRASTVFAHVYDSDGVTLASNQHIAQPGQIVEFDFTITAPGNLPAGGYQLVVQPILEGSSLWNMGGVAWWNVTVQPMTFNATYVTQSAYPTLLQGQSTSAYIRYKNTGNEPWYDDVSAPTYKTYAVHLATSSPINSASPFSATWPSNNRASTVFAHVYDSDGVTLASNQHIAQPGQIVEFDFTITAPGNLPAGGYQLVVQPILEGSSLWNMGGVAWWNVTVTKS